MAGGGPETDAFKHLAAAFTVLRSLGSAKTSSNSESSRIVSIPRRHFNTVKLAGDALRKLERPSCAGNRLIQKLKKKTQVVIVLSLFINLCKIC